MLSYTFTREFNQNMFTITLQWNIFYNQFVLEGAKIISFWLFIWTLFISICPCKGVFKVMKNKPLNKILSPHTCLHFNIYSVRYAAAKFLIRYENVIRCIQYIKERRGICLKQRCGINLIKTFSRNN